MNTESNIPKDAQQPEGNDKRKGAMKWLKRIGVAGFLFFLLKGIAWLVFGAAILRYFGCGGH